MTSLTLMITRAGQARFTAAQLDNAINLGIAQIGLTDAPFVSAPTLEALPGEFKRLTSISGEQVGDAIVHMTIRDESEDRFTARGFGLFLADGTLFATYAQADTLFEKSPRATFLAAIDIAFPTGDISELTFGNTNFLLSPATTTRQGVVELATKTEGHTGTDTTRVPPVSVVQAMLTRYLPAGTITLWAGAADAVPAGWAICNGQVVQRVDGSGAITTPDLRGRVPVGANDVHAVGTAFGATLVERQTTQHAGHTHAATAEVAAAATGLTIATTTRNVDAGGSANGVITSMTVQDPQHTHAATAATESAGEHAHTVEIDVTQPSIALHYIMRL